MTQHSHWQSQSNVLHHDVPFEAYKACPYINASGLKLMMRSPAHYRAAMLDEAPQKESRALELGTLVHTAILEPQRFAEHAVHRPPFKLNTNVGKQGLAEFNAGLAPGAIVVPDSMWDQVNGLCSKVQSVPFLTALLEKGTRETTMTYQDPDTGLQCKVRPDFVSAKGIVVDLKTTQDARPEEFAKACVKYGYGLQSAHYLKGGEVSGAYRHDSFVFVAVETTAPFEIGIYTAGESLLGTGSQWREHLMALYAECTRTGVWPGYERRALTLEVPPWAPVPPLPEL